MIPRAKFPWPIVAACNFLFALVALVPARAQGPAPTPPASAPTTPAAAAPERPAETAPQASPAAAAAPGTTKPSLTKEDLEAFLDGLISLQLQRGDIAGMVVTVVKDGAVLFSKGYGYADFDAKKLVSQEETLFRPGSISKLFTTTAVMQLVEAGKLELDKDVNEYLDFTIPKTYPEPVTLRRLLTHTAGFEETVKNLFVAEAKDMKPLRDYLIAAQPPRIFPPGVVPAYSNYGMSLAGYIVERVSGEPFDRYIAKHILEPLRMTHSTFTQPLPAELEPAMSRGYLTAAKGAKPFEFVQAAPAGSLSATAADMARFMNAFLAEGTLDGVTILKPESVRAMQSRQVENHAALNAMGLGFFEASTNGQKLWAHGGDSIYFHSELLLFPEARVGFFFSYNSAGSSETNTRRELDLAFLDRYFPAPPPAPPASGAALAAFDAKTDARVVSGTYHTSRRAETNFAKALALFDQRTVSVRADDKDGTTLEIANMKDPRGRLKRWQETAPLVFREAGGGPGVVAFRKDPTTGKVTGLFTQAPIVGLQRVPWYENKAWVLPTIGAALFILATTVVLWPVAAIVRWRYGRALFADWTARTLYFLTRLVCLIDVLFLGVFIFALSRAQENIAYLGDRMDAPLRWLHIVGWVGVGGTILLLLTAILLWVRRGEHRVAWWPRLHASLLALAGIIFSLFVWHWHLVDQSLKF